MLFFFIILALLLTGFFSGTEIAFVSANKLLVQLKRKKETGSGAMFSGFYDRPNEFMGAMLVGHNIALVTFTILMSELLTPLIAQTIDSPFLISLTNTLLITIVVMIFGEYLPKTLFRLYAERILYSLAFPIRAMQFLLTAPSWLMANLSKLLLRLFFPTMQEVSETEFTRMDLEQFIKKNYSQSEEDDFDTGLFGRALQLRNVKVKQCMVPRTEIIHVDVSEGVDALRKVIRETSLSRIVIIRDEIDNVLGYVHHQQLLSAPTGFEKLIIEMPFVPETMKIMDLMNKLIKERTSIACVVDEFGGTSGLITLEDILEQLFGEIEDEHDQEEYVETQVSPHEYIFSGRLEIDYLNEKYPDLHLPRGDYHTLSGYLVMTTTTIPEQGTVIEQDGFRFVIELVSNTRVETLRLIQLHQDEDSEPAE